MEQEKIKELLIRYYDGLTTEDEEKALKDYFGGQGIPDDYSTDRMLFSIYDENAPEPTADFIDRLGAITAQRVSYSKQRNIIRYFASAAAGLALIIASYFILSDSRTSEMNDTYSDPELALAEVRSILNTVSRNMKTGTEPLISIKTMSIAPQTLNELGKMNRNVENNLSKLRYLNTLDTQYMKENNK